MTEYSVQYRKEHFYLCKRLYEAGYDSMFCVFGALFERPC